MTKQRHCCVTVVGNATEKFSDALDPERKLQPVSKPFGGDILDLLEWATKDVLEMRAEIATMKYEKFEAGNNQTIFVVRISELRQHVKLLRDAGSYLLKDVGEDSSMLGAVDMRLALATTKGQ